MCAPNSKDGLRFRHIHDFNVALLGKQGWRLMRNTYSFITRVYKVWYYPQTTILDVNIGGNLNFIWRSFQAAQDLLKQGTSCRIGSGASVSKVSDPFIVTENEALKNKIVSSLMVVRGKSARCGLNTRHV